MSDIGPILKLSSPSIATRGDQSLGMDKHGALSSFQRLAVLDIQPERLNLVMVLEVPF